MSTEVADEKNLRDELSRKWKEDPEKEKKRQQEVLDKWKKEDPDIDKNDK